MDYRIGTLVAVAFLASLFTVGCMSALVQGVRVRSVRVPTIYEVPGSGRGRGGSHFRWWADTWRQARVFTRYGRQIIFGAR